MKQNLTETDTAGKADPVLSTGPAPPSSFRSFLSGIKGRALFRLAGWWSIFAGALALNSVCPVCGSTACPVGIGATGLLAGFLAVLKLYGRHALQALTGLFRRAHAGKGKAHTISRSCEKCHAHQHTHN